VWRLAFDETGGPYSGFTHLVVLGDDAERLAITATGTPIAGEPF
jgi:hypothetical protein